MHLIDNYYAQGKAPWVDEDQLNKILNNADILRPILCGKIAPNLDMQLVADPMKSAALHDISADYTILYFWRPDCSACEKSMGEMVQFYEKYKNQGVEVFAVSTGNYEDLDATKEFITQYNMSGWVNAIDPYHRTQFHKKFDVKVTPTIYILDKDKTILYKRVSAGQLDTILSNLLGVE